MTLTLAQELPAFTDSLPPLVGLHGFPRTGKDTAATTLIINHGYKRIALADPIREGLLALDPWVRAGDWSEYSDINRYHARWQQYPYTITPRRLSALIDELGWDGVKSSPIWRFETRVLPQRFGTEFGRETLWDSFWLDVAERRMLDTGHVVITDVRFPNEAEWIRSKDGLLINIVRPGYGAVNNHASETVIECDEILHNDSDVDTLLARLQELVLKHGKD